MMISVEQLHRALGGKICRAKDGTQQVLCPGPTDTGKYTSLSVKPAVVLGETEGEVIA